MTRSQVSLFLLIEGSFGFYSLRGGGRAVLNLRNRDLEVGRVATNIEVISSEVVTFCLVESRTQLQRVALVRVAEVCLGHVVVLLFHQGLGARAA